MDKILVIIKREYLQRVRRRAFIIGTIATPLLLIALSVVPALTASRAAEHQVVVLDQTGDPGLFPELRKSVEKSTVGGKTTVTQEVVPAGTDIEEVRKAHTSDIEKNAAIGYLVLTPGVVEGSEAPKYYSKNVSDMVGNQMLENALSSVITQRRLVKAGFADPEKLSKFLKPVNIDAIKISATGETRDSGQTFFLGFIMVMFLYMTILMYGISTMRGVIEEKQSRIVEVVVSSVKPFQMMLGKLIGIGLVGLTQYLIWVAAGMIFLAVGIPMFAQSGIHLPTIPPALLVYFVIFFVLGYLLFATLYTVVGSMVSTEEDAQQLQFPVTMLIVIPILIFWSVMRDPNSTSSIVLSLIPFFSPTLMITRIAVVTPPLWQIVLSIALMIATIIGIVWLAGRIYRVGILMYGKRPSIAELGRWIRYA